MVVLTGGRSEEANRAIAVVIGCGGFPLGLRGDVVGVLFEVLVTGNGEVGEEVAAAIGDLMTL